MEVSVDRDAIINLLLDEIRRLTFDLMTTRAALMALQKEREEPNSVGDLKP
jgi:hypothetical protein